MALFGSHWNEDDRIPQGRGMLNDLWPKMTWERKIDDTSGNTYYVCSHCGNEEYYQPKYCPECGAKNTEAL